MALSEKDIAEIGRRYERGQGETIGALAQAFDVSTAAIRYQLKKEGHMAATEPQAAPAEDVAPDNPAGPFETDEDLGIGADEPTPALDLNALLAHPDFAKVINAAVEARMGALGRQTSGLPSTDRAFDAFLDKLEHVIGVASEQKPGYIKPWTAEEVDARRRGHSDMLQLIVEFKASKLKPLYLLKEPFYGPSPSGPILYEAGREIITCLPPAENWEPQNEAAAKVYSAYRRWVGDPISVEDLLANAMMNARGGPRVAEVTDEPALAHSDVELVEGAVREVGPTRTLGTVVPETRGKLMPGQPGITGQPVGPFSVGDQG